MIKTVYRHFIDFIDGQEKWLNRMAGQGLRLAGTGRLSYRFEDCKPGEYQYRVEFAANKAYPQAMKYRAFLESLGYRVFTKNVNINASFVKARFRPWSAGKLATSPGGYNKELFIVEKRNNGKPFELHTDAKDAAAYFSGIRNACLTLAIAGYVLALLSVLQFTTFIFPIQGGIAFGIVGLIGSALTAKYGIVAKRYHEYGKTNE